MRYVQTGLLAVLVWILLILSTMTLMTFLSWESHYNFNVSTWNGGQRAMLLSSYAMSCSISYWFLYGRHEKKEKAVEEQKQDS